MQVNFQFNPFMIFYPFRNITHEQHKGLERLEYAPEDLAERSPWSEIEELEDEAIAAIEAAARAVEGKKI